MLEGIDGLVYFLRNGQQLHFSPALAYNLHSNGQSYRRLTHWKVEATGVIQASQGASDWSSWAVKRSRSVQSTSQNSFVALASIFL